MFAFAKLMEKVTETQDAPGESRVDIPVLVAEREKDRAVAKAKAEGKAVVEAVAVYHEKVAQVASGRALWASGSADVTTALPSEFLDRKRAADNSLVGAWRRWFVKNKPSFDTALETDRRAVESAWMMLVAAMTKLESDERAIRGVHPHGVDYPDRTAISELASDGALRGWVTRTWTPKRYQRPPLPRVAAVVDAR